MKIKFLTTARLPLIIAALAIGVSSCNKIYEPVGSSGVITGDAANTLYKKLAANSNYSILVAALTRTGLWMALDQPTSSFTFFAPDNAAFTASGLSLAAVNAMPEAQLLAVLQHHLIPNQKIMAADIPTTFANFEVKSALNLTTAPISATAAIPIKMSVFPSRRAGGAWINNMPIKTPDAISGSNGVVHTVAAIVAPPTRLLLDTISRDPEFKYLVAAIQRADSGLSTTAAPSIQYYLGNATIAPGANFTVFAPTDAAFKALVYGLVYKQVFTLTGNAAAADAQANLAVAAGPAFLASNNVTTELVRGILAYHVIPLQRAFGVNFPTTPAAFPTFLNTVIASHPGITVGVTLSGTTNMAVALSVKGVGNATPAAAVPTALGIDRPAVNGVFYKIDQVLLPQ